VRFAADSSDSYYMRGTLMAALRRMEASGSSFLDALQHSNVYDIIPDNIFILLRVGSKGNLGQIMLKLAERKQKEILRLSKQVGDKLAFSVIMPAALILVFLVLSIELPIWDIMNNNNLSNMGGGM
jgi:Type II secretory pathway, component PulF